MQPKAQLYVQVQVYVSYKRLLYEEQCVGPLVADVPRGLSHTSPHELKKIYISVSYLSFYTQPQFLV
jgi:hypothetical protein